MTLSAELPSRYSAAIRILHWLMAVGILVTMLLGFYGGDWLGLSRKSAWMLHQSLGFSLAVLLLFRIGFRKLQVQPGSFPGTAIEMTLARMGHLALYVLMAAAVATGIGMKALAGKAIPFFGVHIFLPLPVIPELAKMARHYHEPVIMMLIAMILLHALAAFKHQVIERSPILKRIL